MATNRRSVQKRADAKRADSRDRNWTLVVYPDSAPENWRQILDSYAVPWAASPLHDADENADGGEKKAHWHVLITFRTMKSYAQVAEIAAELNAPIPQICKNTVGMTRYFVHADNPEKHQYDRADIDVHNGFNASRAFDTAAALSADERMTILFEAMEWCDQNQIVRVKDLLDEARRPEKRETWGKVMVTSSGLFVMREYINGIWQALQEAREREYAEKYVKKPAKETENEDALLQECQNLPKTENTDLEKPKKEKKFFGFFNSENYQPEEQLPMFDE